MPPVLTNNAPSTGTPGESFDIVLDGQGFEAGTTVSLGDGVAVAGLVVRSPQQLSATVTLAETAAFGPRDITITNPGGEVATFAARFFVLDRSEKDRKAFLLAMYTQMWKNIDTHILVVWQSVAAVLGALAIFSLVQKGFLPVDLASAFIVMLSAWLLAHVYDAWEWFHRNLVILTNIERQFLRTGDLKAINPFFAQHRPAGRMLTHLVIQWCLGLGIAIMVLTYHFLIQVLPGFGSSWDTFEPIRCLPYAAAIVAAVLLVILRQNVVQANREVTQKAPGLPMAQ